MPDRNVPGQIRASQSGGHLRDIHSLIDPFSGVLDTWHPHIYDLSQPENSDQWGTANPMNEMVGR